MHRLLGLVAITLIPTLSSATVEPSLESLSGQATTILVGLVSDVQRSGETKRVVTLKVQRCLKGKCTKSLSFEYQQIGKEDISFEALRQSAKPHVFFLRSSEGKRPSLVDAWFGARPASFDLMFRLNNVISDSKAP